MLDNFLDGDAAQHFQACQQLGEMADGGAHNWPSAVNCLLEQYASNDAINAAVKDLRRTRQLSGQTEAEFHTAFLKPHSRAGAYLSESELITAFIDGLDSRIRSRVREFRDYSPGQI